MLVKVLPYLETLRVHLIELISNFTMIIAKETLPAHSVGGNSVPEEWEEDQLDFLQLLILSTIQQSK